MLSFYRHLLAGRSKAEALRQAQLELWRGATPSGEPARRPPFYWAAFQVHGAWD
jgi:CHAT domain-containing protein